jgi:hypothetical protein
MTRLTKLRVVYGLVLANVVLVGLWGELIDVPLILGKSLRLAGFPASSFMPGLQLFMALSLGVAAAPFIFLVVRPMGWGKFLLLFAAMSWTMHVAAGAIIGLASLDDFAPLLGAAAAMVVLAIAHQVIDPSLIGRRNP